MLLLLLCVLLLLLLLAAAVRHRTLASRGVVHTAVLTVSLLLRTKRLF